VNSKLLKILIATIKIGNGRNQIPDNPFILKVQFSPNPILLFLSQSAKSEGAKNTIQINHFFKQSFFVNKRAYAVSQNPLTKISQIFEKQ
jgi:hypothetical protein